MLTRVRLLAAILHDGVRLDRGTVVDLPLARAVELTSRRVAQVVNAATPLTAPASPQPLAQVAAEADAGELPADEQAEIDQAVEHITEGWAARSRRSKNA